MIVGVYTFEVLLPGARSLKDKRQVVRRIKERLRSRFNVSVAELDADDRKRSSIAVAAIATTRDVLEKRFEDVHAEASRHVPGTLVETGTEYIEGVEGDASGWSGDWG